MNEILKPGKYFLGDPSAVLPSKILYGIWQDVYQFEMGKFYINDTHFCVHNTHNGDGIFYDTRDRKYQIDGGVIGLVDISLIEDINLCNNIGYIYDFKEKINFYYDIGIFIIKSGKKYIKISTRIENEYCSDEEEVCLNDKNENISNVFCNDSDDDFIDDENENYFNNNTPNDSDEDEQVINKTESKFQFFKKK
jgi:hypothetical protein